MANGAAGCGYEYRNHSGSCGFLSREGEKIEDAKECKFTCLKYKEPLKQQRNTGEPFRCTKCTNQEKPI
jgi:hypothetical protein